ncbi:MAG: CoA pyrophosphatase [Pirellulales bacterium]|nr:CoA pyrophosphatase [Pirellulales bacterium]
MFDQKLPDKLRCLLEGPLPGPEVASRFEPGSRVVKHYAAPPDGAREAAVLVLLYPSLGQWHVPLTVRGEHLDHHAGQVSLPGGAVEPGETSAGAAIREFHEELGAEGLNVELLGRLTPLYVATSNFRVEPWVGAAAQRGDMRPNQQEVDRLLEVPLNHLLDPSHFGRHQREKEGRRFEVPHFAWEDYLIWGATCMILGEFITLLGRLDEQNERW